MKKYALVTGASRGLGRATATHLSRIGFTVICSSRDEQELEAVVAELEGQGHVRIAADLSEDSSFMALVDQVQEVVGQQGLKLLVHCAAATPDPEAEAELGDTPLNVLDTHLSVTARSGAVLIRALKQALAAAAPSHAVHISSDWTIPGYAGPPAFSAAKEYLASIWRHSRVEFLKEGVVLARIVAGNIATYDEAWEVPKWTLDSTKKEIVDELGNTRIYMPDIIKGIELIINSDLAAVTEINVVPLDPDYVP